MAGRNFLDSLKFFESHKSKKKEDEKHLEYVGAKLSCSALPHFDANSRTDLTSHDLLTPKVSFTKTLNINEVNDRPIRGNDRKPTDGTGENNNNNSSSCFNSKNSLCQSRSHECKESSDRSDSVNKNFGDNSDSKSSNKYSSDNNNSDSSNKKTNSDKKLCKNKSPHPTAASLSASNELQQYKGFLKLSLCGLILIALSYAIYIINPVDLIKAQRLRFFEGSFAYGLWRKPPVKVYINVYIFNVTNSEAFMKGEADQLELKEIGPYVYWEELENQNVTFHANRTLSYSPVRLVHYDAELSVGDPDLDYIVVPNVPLLGISSMLYNSSMLVNLGLRTLVTYLDTKPFREITVHQYLWGYDEPLVHLASNILPTWINFAKFGLLDRMLDEGRNRITMNIPSSKDSDSRSFTIADFNGQPGLGQWGLANATQNSICGSLQGSTEGLLYPQHLTPDKTFNIYRKAFCRTLPIEYYEEGVSDRGVKVYKYKFAKGIFDSPYINANNECYCKREFAPCLPSGLSDLSPCYYNIPVAVSFPHFYQADPVTLWKLKGLSPNKTRHESSITIQPELGVPITVDTKVQINLVMHNTKYIPRVKLFNNMTIPIFWLHLEVNGLPDSLNVLIDLLLVVAPPIQTASILGFSLAGLALLTIASVGYVISAGFLRNKSRMISNKPPILKATWGAKYSPVHIIPIIRHDHFIARGR